METNLKSGSVVETNGENFIKSEPTNDKFESDTGNESFNGKYQ